MHNKVAVVLERRGWDSFWRKNFMRDWIWELKERGVFGLISCKVEGVIYQDGNVWRNIPTCVGKKQKQKTLTWLVEYNIKPFETELQEVYIKKTWFWRTYYHLDGELVVHDIGRDGEGILWTVGSLNWAHVGPLCILYCERWWTHL